MKKHQCLICGWDIDDSLKQCSNCKSDINMEINTGSNKIETLKYNVKNNCIMCDFKANVRLLEDTYNELLLEYYKMFTYKNLKKEYDESYFFNNTFNYNSQELENIILHVLEHSNLYQVDNVKKIISTSRNSEKYLNILQSINSQDYQKPIENELRTLLFNKVYIPKSRVFSATFEESKSYVLLSILLYIVFIAAVLIFSDKDIRTPMMNLALTFPSFILSKGLTRFIVKKNNVLFTILFFIAVFYITTLIYYMISNGFSSSMFIEHIKSVVLAPVDLFKTMLERFGENNEV